MGKRWRAWGGGISTSEPATIPRSRGTHQAWGPRKQAMTYDKQLLMGERAKAAAAGEPKSADGLVCVTRGLARGTRGD